MRILHILDHSVPAHSGYAYRTLEILREQVKAGFDVLLLTGPKQRSSARWVELVEGWEFLRTEPANVPYWAPKAIREYVVVRALARRAEEVARQRHATLLHAHSPVLNALAALSVGARLSLPVVYEVRALWEDALASHGAMKDRGIGYALARNLETYSVHRAHAVVTISHGLRRDLSRRGVREENLFLVPNAVDVGRFTPAHAAPALGGATTRPVIGFVGSFYSYEGLDLLLEAAKRIVAARPEARFVLVGGGREEQRLRELCGCSSLSAHVSFTGWLPHERIADAYRAIDILVYPRRRNRLTELVTPLKPLEAMAMAKVVVASDVGGHRELIEHGRTGFLFKADDVSALVMRLQELLEASHTWPEIGAAARRFVERERTWQAVAATYAEVYERARSRGR